MVKLSQQLNGRLQEQRPTRTQRVASKQQEQEERATFENLKARANAKQQQLSGLTINQYEKEYNLLDPKLKRFFSTPETLRIEKTERIDTTKQTIQERLAFADQKLLEEKLKFEKDITKARERYGRDKKRNRVKARERLDEKEHRLEDEFDEDEAKWKGYKEGLQKGSKELDKNKDVTFKSIDDFAWDIARFEEDREEARNDKKAFDRKQKDEIKRLEEQGFTPQIIKKSFKGKPTSIELTFFNPKTKQIKKVAKFDVKAPIDVSGLKRVGFSQPQTRTVEFGGKSFSFQSRIGIFKEKSGEIVTPFQKTGITEQDLIKQNKNIISNTNKERISINHKIPQAQYGSWNYNAEMGLFSTPSEPSGQATAIFRSPTINEKTAIDTAQKKGDYYGHLITGLPAQYLQTLGGISSKQIGMKDLEESGALDSTLNILNPKTHYKIWDANYKIKQEIKDISPFIKKYDIAFEDYEKVKITQTQVNKGIVSDEQILISNQASSKVNAIIKALESETNYKSYKSRGRIITIDELVGKSPQVNNALQFAYGGATGVSKMLPYLTPPTRIIMGADLTMQGLDKGTKAMTTVDQAVAFGTTGLGMFVTYSGVKGLMPDISKTITATTTKGLTTRKALTHTGIIGLSSGVGVLDAYGNYKRSKNIYQAVGSGVGTTTTLLGGAYFKPALRKINDWERTIGKERLRTPKLDAKPFARKSGGEKGYIEEVFMKRYTGLKLKDARTWKPFLKRQQKGSFLSREYRIIDPKVEARFKGMDKVTYWKWKGNKQIKVTESTETFPKDTPSQHKQWFDQSSKIKQFYIPKKTLKEFLKDHKSFGYSATDKAWTGKEYADDILTDAKLYGKSWKMSQKDIPKKIKVGGAYQFSSGKGLSPAFLRIGNKEMRLMQIDGNTAQSPTVYANYFKGSQVNPAKAEIKALSKALKDAGAKDPYLKYYILSKTAKAGNIQLPIGKHEVEGVLEFTKRIPIRSHYYFKFGGRNVMIEDQIFTQSHNTKHIEKIVNKIISIRGGGEGTTKLPTTLPSYSTLTSVAHVPSISKVLSKMAYSPPQSKIMSIKEILKASEISKVSNLYNSYKPSLPKSSKISDPTSIVSKIISNIKSPTSSPAVSSISLTSSIQKIISSDPIPPSNPALAYLIYGKRKKKKEKKKRKKALFERLYLPDFTSRALGLEAVTVTQKQAQRQLKRLLSGLEIRRAVKIK